MRKGGGAVTINSIYINKYTNLIRSTYGPTQSSQMNGANDSRKSNKPRPIYADLLGIWEFVDLGWEMLDRGDMLFGDSL